MAQNLVVNFIGENKLSKTTAVVSSDLRKFGNVANTVSKNFNRAFGAAGIGLGLAQLSKILKQSTKAAVEDGKSQALLANALRNTVGATSGAIAGAEKYIAKTQLSASVLDDELRPALATAVRATGSLSAGQDLLNTALDVSAGTGKNLGTVTNAISKAFNGNTGALRKLLPSIKDGADFMEQLKEQFEGSADIAAKNDPYKRLQILFEDIQETIGAALIPALEEFTEYLTSTEGQKNLQQIVNLFVEAGKAVSTVTKFVIANITVIKALVAALVTMKLGWMAITGAVKAYDFAVKIAAISTKALRTALVTTGFGAIAVALGFVAEAFITASESADKFNTAVKASDLKPGESYWDFQKRKASEAWSNSYTAKAAMEAKGSVKKVGKAITDGLSEGAKQITRTAERFRDSVGLALGTFGKDENSVFNVDVVINKLKRMVDAAKGFAGNLEKLRKQGAGADVISEIVGMGPAQGNIVAKGLLQSGKLSQYLGLRGSLFNTGAQVGAVQESTEAKTYSININKANVSAEDIIKAIRTYEKKHSKKYFVSN
jgi:hypothetical protein